MCFETVASAHAYGSAARPFGPACARRAKAQRFLLASLCEAGSEFVPILAHSSQTGSSGAPERAARRRLFAKSNSSNTLPSMSRIKFVVFATALCSALAASAQSFSVSFPASRSAQPLDGRLLLCLSTDSSDEPRNQINDTPKSQLVFGVTVDGLKPGEP